MPETLLNPAFAPKAVVDFFVKAYETKGPHLHACDRMSARIYMDKIVEAGGSFCNVSFKQCRRGIIVYNADTDTMCSMSTIVPYTEGPRVDVALVPISGLDDL